MSDENELDYWTEEYMLENGMDPNDDGLWYCEREVIREMIREGEWTPRRNND